MTTAAFSIFSILAAATTSQAQGDTTAYLRLFDTETLKGWKGRAETWSVKSGAITGGGPLTGNTFLVTDSLYADFHLVLEARMPTAGSRNSGIVYRGEVVDTYYRARGYQLDISDGYWGSFYHEMGNELGWTPVSTCSAGGSDDWRTVEIVANGPKVAHYVGGKKCFEKSDFQVLKKGVIGLQMHSPGSFTVEFRRILIRPLNGSFRIPEGQVYNKDGTPRGATGLRASGAASAAAAPEARLRVSLERGLSVEASRGGGLRRFGLDGKALR